MNTMPVDEMVVPDAKSSYSHQSISIIDLTCYLIDVQFRVSGIVSQPLHEEEKKKKKKNQERACTTRSSKRLIK